MPSIYQSKSFRFSELENNFIYARLQLLFSAHHHGSRVELQSRVEKVHCPKFTERSKAKVKEVHHVDGQRWDEEQLKAKSGSKPNSNSKCQIYLKTGYRFRPTWAILPLRRKTLTVCLIIASVAAQ